MSKTALLIITDGSEEMEVVITADVLRRAGVKVTIANLEGTDPAICSRDVAIKPDKAFRVACSDIYDAVILPGGLAGAEAFAKNEKVKEVLQSQQERGGLIAAICAAPIALKSHAIGQGKKITSHPSKKAELSTGEYTYLEDRVVVDGSLITSRGPGTAFEFALSIVKYFFGEEKATSLADSMFVQCKVI